MSIADAAIAVFHCQISTSSDIASTRVEEMPSSNRVRNLRRNGRAMPRRQKRRWPSHHVARNQLASLQPAGATQEESTPFVLDLQNLPGLANVDLSAQNPNIQVDQLVTYFTAL